MLARTAFEMSINHVTLASDDERQKSAHKFQYNLNTAKTKKNLYEGAMRGHYERETKKTCINLIFSDGAFNEVVLKALIELKTGPKHFIVGKEDVERVAIDPRTELSGKHVDTKIEFKVNRSKLVIHAYNTRQKLTIQGKKHKWFVDNYLEPFFKLRISNSMVQIEEINREVLSNLNPNLRTTSHEENTLDEDAEIIQCDKCDFSTIDGNLFRKHISSLHQVNLFQGLNFESTSSDERTDNAVQQNYTVQHEIEEVVEIMYDCH